MRIRSLNAALRRIASVEVTGGAEVVFNKKHHAEVDDELGAKMCEEFPESFTALKSGKRKVADSEENPSQKED